MVLSLRRSPWGSGLLAAAVVLSLAACGGGGGGSAPIPPPPTSSDAALSGLGISTGSLSPIFSSGTLDYDVGPDLLAETVRVTPTAANANASIRVNGVLTSSGSASAPIPLPMGTTTVTVLVTAQDGTTTRTYRIDFDATSGVLTDLVFSAGTFAPTFDPDTLTYTLPCLTCGTTTVTPTALDPNVGITVNGDPATSGDASAPIALDAGETVVTIQVSARDGTTSRAYTVTVDRSLAGQDEYFKASTNGSGDLFGSVVALSGDTMVVTAPFEDSNAKGVGGDQGNNGAVDSGAAYVFVRTDGVWTQQAYLKASNTDAGDLFGISAHIDGDTIVVGAMHESSAAMGVDGDHADNTASHAGAAYVFTRSGTTWTQQAYLKASNTDPNDLFGIGVAVDGNTVLVGASDEESNGSSQDDNTAVAAGAAYVFTRSGIKWTQQAYLKASNVETQDGFGENVALDGDTVVIGAAFESSAAQGVGGDANDNTAPNAGAAYVFVRSGTTWSQQAYLKASNTAAGQNFGLSVTLSGDTIAVGSPDEDSAATGIDGVDTDTSATDAGAVYVFTRSGATWTQQAYVKASNTEANDAFFAARLDGDLLVVGAPGEDSGATGIDGDDTDNSVPESGAAYVFVRAGSTWSQLAYVKASNPGSEDLFGRLGTVGVDGNRLAIGAPFEDSSSSGIGGSQGNNGSADSGAVYTFD